jgi:hypothetical protein
MAGFGAGSTGVRAALHGLIVAKALTVLSALLANFSTDLTGLPVKL